MRIGRYISLGVLLSATLAVGQGGIGPITTQVPQANQDVGHPNNRIAPGFRMRILARGTDALENPSGVITTFGSLSDGTKTEPDQNQYLVTPSNPGGPVPGLDYGRHFLFQGHEVFSGNLAYVTRLNLDVKDPAHKITLLTPVDGSGQTGLTSLDGIAYNPFTKRLLVTEEAGSTTGGVIEVNSTWPSTTTTLYGIIGQGGYEGIHVDDQGSIFLVEDSGGTKVNVDPNDPNSPKVARQPNSFIYRFLPYDKTNLSAGGQLQALQVSIDGLPLVFNANDPVGDTFAIAQVQLHTPGTSYPVQWVTIHDTAVDGTAAFDANAAAKTALATPFKRPENGFFLPGSHFLTFFFTITGDTDSLAGNVVELAERGAWGGIFRVDLNSDRATGLISIFVLGDAIHNSFDNITFADQFTLLTGEDRGNTLHTELNTLDSVWAYSVNGAQPPLRFIAEGRDATAEAEGEDNEPTGVHVSGGNPNSLPGSLGDLFNARGFFTQQHGDNLVWEVGKSF